MWRWALAQDHLVYQLKFANIYLLLQAVMEMKKKIMISPKEEVILLGIVFVGRFHNN